MFGARMTISCPGPVTQAATKLRQSLLPIHSTICHPENSPLSKSTPPGHLISREFALDPEQAILALSPAAPSFNLHHSPLPVNTPIPRLRPPIHLPSNYKSNIISTPHTVNMRSKFKDEHEFSKRKAEAERIRQKYADRIPVSTAR